jgi:DNA-binding GntR family transcriptional regulator
LRAAILDGSLEAGAPLREGQIATALGVSRAPVREALRNLEQEGLVTKVGYRGAFVASASAETLNEVMSIRARIEPYAVERSLPVFIADGFGHLERLLSRLAGHARTGRATLTVDAHIAFHRAFYEFADHRLLLDTWRALEPALRLHLLTAQLASRHAEHVIKSHRELLDIIRSGSLKSINRRLADHILSVDDARHPTRSNH